MTPQGPMELAQGEFVVFIAQCKPSQIDSFAEALKVAWNKIPARERNTILSFYNQRTNNPPLVMLGTRAGSTSPVAMGGGKDNTLMCWFDSLALGDLPHKETGQIVVIGEELAHAYLLASQHPTHISEPPTTDVGSPEFQRWIDAKEEAATDVHFNRWPFDRAEHARVLAWLKSRSAGATRSSDYRQ